MYENIFKAYENAKEDVDRWYMNAMRDSIAENKKNDAIECIFCIGKAVELSLILQHDFGEDTKEERESLKKIKDYLQFDFLLKSDSDSCRKEFLNDKDLIDTLRDTLRKTEEICKRNHIK